MGRCECDAAAQSLIAFVGIALMARRPGAVYFVNWTIPTLLIVISRLQSHIEEQTKYSINTLSVKVVTRTNVIFKFVQRALWLYVAEAVVILAIVMTIRVYT
jgi:hypothetical protein